jgi:amidohydrolase
MITFHETAPVPSLDLPPEIDIIALRRDFHAHPELGYEEVRTSGIVAQRLRDLGLEVREGVGVTGVIGILRGEAGDGPTALLRADMDALPVEEENGWAWKSTISKKMHACGHDGHTAILLTVARLLVAQKSELRGSVVFMFQPAEEGLGGAGRMIEDGLLDCKPDFALGLHIWSEVEVGLVAVSDGPVMASTDSFTCTIQGKGGHGAIPHETIDPIVIAAQLISGLHTVVSRNIHPVSAGVVTVGRVTAGSSFNIIPDVAEIEGTVRAFDDTIRATLERRCRELCEELPHAFGATATFDYQRQYPATINNSDWCDHVRSAAAKVVGESNVVPFVPTMGAEDFSLVLQQVPGCYFFVGARNPEIDAVYPHHHPRFSIDERALMIGAQTFVEAVRAQLT